jgi:hypothetical protein
MPKRCEAFSFPKKVMWLIVLLSISAYEAVSQVESGTVIIVFRSQDEVVFATDGRGQSTDGTNPADNDCKLVALDKNLISAFGGMTGIIDSRNGIMDKVAHSTARDDLRKIRQDEPDRPKALAVAWGRHIKTIMDRELSDKHIILPKQHGGITGFFAGNNKAGNLVGYRQTLLCNCTQKPVQFEIEELEPLNISTDGLPSDISSTPAAVVIYAYLRKIGLSGIPKSYYSGSGDRNAATTMYFADQIVAFAHDPAIGGKIDALKIMRGQSYQWVAAPNCQPSQSTNKKQAIIKQH